MNFNLNNKVALVTGAASGLGRSFSMALASSGADLVCVDYDSKALEFFDSIMEKSGRRFLSIVADVSRVEDVERMISQTYDYYGRLDIAVNNAGIIHKPYRFHEIPLEEWNRLISIDLTGVFICMQKEIQLMLRQGYGNIINISSILGTVGLDPELLPRAGYIAAKHGVIGLTRQAALEYAGNNIRVNAIAPGWFAGTDIAKERLKQNDIDFSQREKKIIDFTPLHRRGNPEELNGLLVYLASDESSFITGQVLTVDGGWTTH